ncbi:hypothetical protein [Allobaculum fili]|uniref:hypothetical protein n=1 Tax=Allobaculum fili TaxID=2834460 RepID=UPI001E3D8A38|nr:hypothetical protein [Allobaculum fili]
MKMISVREAQVKWMNAPKSSRLSSLRLLTFKKDRSVCLKKENGQFLLVEDGYLHQEIELPADGYKKLLKQAFAREFPRSSRLYIQEN